jgi:hypothetical protein
MQKNLGENSYVLIVLSVAIWILAFVLDKLYNLVRLDAILAGMGATLVAVTAIAVVGHRVLYGPVASKLANLEGTMAKMESMIRADRIITRAMLRDIESTIDVQQIWIVTSSLEEDIDRRQFADVIQQNLTKNVTYTYFIPDTSEVRVRAERMQATFRNSSNLLFKFINDVLFGVAAGQDIVIFGPEGEDLRNMVGYMGLPAREGGFDYYIELSERQASRVVGAFRVLSAQRQQFRTHAD